MVIPITILMCVLTGSLIRAFWGWLNSKEPFNARKFGSTIIPTIFAALLVGSTMMNSNIILDDGGLMTMAIMALVAGWGIDDGMKQLSRMKK